MADNEPTISMAGVNAPPLYRLVEDGDTTIICTYDTNTPMWRINGKIGGDTVEVMTTAERTAITPEAGQLIFDTTLGILFVGDGSTQGGTAVGGGGGGGVVPGYRLSDDGTALNFNPIQPIVNVTGSSVTLVPDTAYKMYATTGAVTINANPPASGYWGLESHIELFVGSTGYVVTGTNVVLANALEPDAVSNCTVRFHDGLAIIAVEDHVAGYIVVNGSTSGEGSLYYGITTSTNDYVAFDASLNGTAIPLAGAVAEGEKHVVGNGYNETTLTGAVDCGTSKFTVANLGLNNVQIVGGTLTLGDAYIPSGSTVAVSGGGLAVEKVTGAGSASVIDLGGEHLQGGGTLTSITLTNGGNTTGMNGGAYYVAGSGNAITLSGCTVSGNKAQGALYGAGGYLYNLAQAHIYDCLYSEDQNITLRYGGVVNLHGSNVFLARINTNTATQGGSGFVTLTSGAILDLTGNTNATPIAPGGGITFERGGATVLYSSGAVSGSYMMDNVTLPAGAKLTNTAVVNIGGTEKVVIPSGATASASGVEFTSGNGNLRVESGATIELTSCNLTSGTSQYGAGLYVSSSTAKLTGCTVSNNSGSNPVYCYSGELVLVDCNVTNAITMRGTGNVVISGIHNAFTKIRSFSDNPQTDATVIISSGVSITLGDEINFGGNITVLEGGCTVNGNTIGAGVFGSISSDGTTTPAN